MTDKQSEQVLQALAELVVWYGEEDNATYCKRLERSRRLVRRLAPDTVKAEQEQVKALYDK